MIDIQTFMLALGVGNTAFALLMAGYMRGAAPNPGLRTWMWARLSSGLAQICCWVAPHVGLPIAEELAAFGWVGGVALELVAVGGEIKTAHQEEQHHRQNHAGGNDGGDGTEIVHAFARLCAPPRHTQIPSGHTRHATGRADGGSRRSLALRRG